MIFSSITLVYAVIDTIHHTFDFVLDFLNTKYMKDRIDHMPDFLLNRMDLPAYRKAIIYNLASFRFDIPYRLSRIALHWIFIFSGFEILDSLLRSLDFDPLLTGLLFFGLYSLVYGILDLPFSIYHDFILEERFGFNRKTWQVFLIDLFKNAFLNILIGAPLLLAILWIMSRAGSFWWLYCIALILVFLVLMLWLAPALILPIYNKLTPLQGPIRNEIDNLARKAGFPARDVLTMDGSRRSGHANAFFTGIGKTKKIIFYDTLLEQITPSQILSVLAHEIGHYVLGHVRKRLLMSVIGLILFFTLIGSLRDQLLLYPSLGFQTPSDYAALLIFSLLFSELAFPFGLIQTRISRKHEYESDAFAISVTGDPESLIEALEILHITNLASPISHPAFVAVRRSHPDLHDRVTAIRQISHDTRNRLTLLSSAGLLLIMPRFT